MYVRSLNLRSRIEDTLATLKFCSYASEIKLKPVENPVAAGDQIRKLKLEVTHLKKILNMKVGPVKQPRDYHLYSAIKSLQEENDRLKPFEMKYNQVKDILSGQQSKYLDHSKLEESDITRNQSLFPDIHARSIYRNAPDSNKIVRESIAKEPLSLSLIPINLSKSQSEKTNKNQNQYSSLQDKLLVDVGNAQIIRSKRFQLSQTEVSSVDETNQFSEICSPFKSPSNLKERSKKSILRLSNPVTLTQNLPKIQLAKNLQITSKFSKDLKIKIHSTSKNQPKTFDEFMEKHTNNSISANHISMSRSNSRSLKSKSHNIESLKDIDEDQYMVNLLKSQLEESKKKMIALEEIGKRKTLRGAFPGSIRTSANLASYNKTIDFMKKQMISFQLE